MKVTNETYKEYSQMVYRYLISMTRDPALAEELTQETFYQAVKNVNRFDGSCRFSTWLCAIAKNQLAGYRRRHQKLAPMDEMAGWDGKDRPETRDTQTMTPEQTVLSEYGRVDIMKKLHAMDEPIREVMYLRIFGNLTFAQIGEITGRTENWARVTYYRGKEKLRKGLEHDV